MRLREVVPRVGRDCESLFSRAFCEGCRWRGGTREAVREGASAAEFDAPAISSSAIMVLIEVALLVDVTVVVDNVDVP